MLTDVWPLNVDKATGLGRRVLGSDFFVLGLCVVLLAVLLPFADGMGTPQNVRNVLANMWPLLVIAVGQTFVLITGGIDLAQTAIMGLVSVVAAALVTQGVQAVQFEPTPLWGTLISSSGTGLLASVPLAVPIALALCLGFGAALGSITGLAIARLRMPPFMVTLVGLTLLGQLSIWMTRGEKVDGLPPEYGLLGSGGELVSLGLASVTPALIVALAVTASAHIVLTRTVFGRSIYLVGANPSAARLSGVSVDRTIVLAYAVSGSLAALGGLLYSARQNIGNPTLGQEGNVLLDIIGATVIGGTSLYGGRGKVIWTVFGVLFFVLLTNGLSLLNIPFYLVTIAKGLAILGAVALDTARYRIGLRPVAPMRVEPSAGPA